MARDDYGFGNVWIFVVTIARFVAVFGIVSFHVAARFAPQDANFVGKGFCCDGMIASDHDDFDTSALVLFYGIGNGQTWGINESHDAEE